MIRDFAPGEPRHGYVVAQGSSSTVNLVKELPRLEQAGINVKVIAAVSEELFDRQPEAYRHAVLPPEAYYDLMVVSTGTRRMLPVRNAGAADRRVLADVGLGQPVAHGRAGAGSNRRGAPRSRVDIRGYRAIRARARAALGEPAGVIGVRELATNEHE